MNILTDLNERQEALDIKESFLVQAPAGSGKTELLIQRFLKLLSACVSNPEEIIAITFTRKAATEMRQRIIAALELALIEDSPINNHQRATWELATQVIKKDQQHNWGIIQNPSRLRIMTIDAFSARLTRQLPILSQFGSQPDIEEHVEMLFEKASEQLLINLEKDFPWNASLEILLNYLDNDSNKAHRLFISMLHNRDQWLPYIIQKNPRDVLEKALKNIIEHHLEKVSTLLNHDKHLLELLSFAASNLRDHSLCAYHEKTMFFPARIEFLCQWQAIAYLLLTEAGEFRNRFTKNEGFPPLSEAKNSEEKLLFQQKKEELIRLLEKYSAEHELKKSLVILKSLPSAEYTNAQWNVLNALVILLPVLVAQLYLLFKQTGTVDYTEITLRALQALGQPDNPTDLALALDYAIQHILVDEFQDTSVNQFRLLELLTAGWEKNDGRTLFLVGDPMQSIYRFRKAEVGLFIKARDYGINQIKLKFLQLKVNFRSTPAIVEWNNTVYSKIFPTEDDLGMSQVKFSCSEACQTTQYDSEVKLHSFFSEHREAEAQRIIELIENAYVQNPTVKIAILVLARSHLEQILIYLKQHDVPYRAVELENLFHNPAIQDLLSLAKALVNLSDKIAWFSILRAPWCGLSLADLLTIKQNCHNEIILDTLEKYDLLPLSDKGKSSLKRMVPVLKRAWLCLTDYDFSYLVESVWLAIGGPACINDNDSINIRRFFECLEQFEKKYDLNDIAILERKLKKLTAESFIPKKNYVEIMTIHKSKGLEFDIVLIPGLDKSTRGDDHQLLVWQEIPLPQGEAELVLAPIKSTKKDPIYDYIRYLDKEKLNNEINRLLYVATTRAKSQLHLLFALELNEDNIVKEPKSGSLLSQLWPAIESEIIYNDIRKFNTINLETMNKKQIKVLSSAWQHPYPFALETMIFKNQNSLLINRRHATWQFEQERIFGTVFHEVMEKIPFTAIDKWDVLSEQEKFQLATTLIRKNIVPQEAVLYFIETLVKAFDNMFTDPFGRWILNSNALSEYEVNYVSENSEIKKSIIDKIIVTDDIVWIIDFKTALPMEQTNELFLKTQKKHYAEQLLNYKKIMGDIYQQPIRAGLYFPLIPAWIEYT